MQDHHTVGAKNRTEAQRQLTTWQQVLEEDPTSVLVTGANVTVRGLIEEWLVHSEARGRSPSDTPRRPSVGRDRHLPRVRRYPDLQTQPLRSR